MGMPDTGNTCLGSQVRVADLVEGGLTRGGGIESLRMSMSMRNLVVMK